MDVAAEHLWSLGAFRSCKSTAEIKEKNEELKKEKGYILDLVAGTKTALNHMKMAKKRAEAAKKKEKERAAKKEQKQREEDEKAADPQRKRRRTSGRKRQHPVLADENQRVPAFSASTWVTRWGCLIRTSPSEKL